MHHGCPTILAKFSDLIISYHFGVLLFLEHAKPFPASDLIISVSLEYTFLALFMAGSILPFGAFLKKVFLNHSICTNSPNPHLLTVNSVTYHPVYFPHRTTCSSPSVCIVCLLPSECKLFTNREGLIILLMTISLKPHT